MRKRAAKKVLKAHLGVGHHKLWHPRGQVVRAVWLVDELLKLGPELPVLTGTGADTGVTYRADRVAVGSMRCLNGARGLYDAGLVGNLVDGKDRAGQVAVTCARIL